MYTGKPSFLRSLIVMSSLAAVMLTAVIKYDSAPHIPMLFGCVMAGITALCSGSRWEDIEQGMIEGIHNSLSSLIILLLIGVLMGIWILDGVVPSMVYYGLAILSPQIFLPTAMLLCAALSMIVGSWGTIGTIGLALMGLAQALGLPLSAAAGAIVSGSYLGDKISPLSDTANLASAITSVDIFENIKYKIWLPLSALTISAGLFLVLGLRFPTVQNVGGQIEPLRLALAEHFSISPFSFLPLILLIGLMLLRFPAIPSIAASIMAAVLQCMLFRQVNLAQVLNSCMNGFESKTGISLLDTLLTAGGLNSMLYSLSMIICAMMFGGIMDHTGQMDALMRPILKHVQSFGMLIAATVSSCILVNIFIPEEYISISIPGSLFSGEFDKRHISRKELAYTIGAGGSATSSLIPWNTCGVFIASVLGLSPLVYAPYAFYNLLLPVLTILTAVLTGNGKKIKTNF